MANAFKKNQSVRFRTRNDKPAMAGTVKSSYDTLRGTMFVIKGVDGVERKLRAGSIQAA